MVSLIFWSVVIIFDSSLLISSLRFINFFLLSALWFFCCLFSSFVCSAVKLFMWILSNENLHRYELFLLTILLLRLTSSGSSNLHSCMFQGIFWFSFWYPLGPTVSSVMSHLVSKLCCFHFSFCDHYLFSLLHDLKR